MNAGRIDRRRGLRLFFGLASAAGLVILPRIVQVLVGTADFAVSYDPIVEIALLWLSLWIASGWTVPPRYAIAGWRAVVLAAPWALLASFEFARVGARRATNEELPMYDAILLSRFLYILARDLYGVWAKVGLTAAVLSPLLLWGLGTVLFGRVEAALRDLGPRRSALAIGGAAALVSLGELHPESRFSTPYFVDNASRSYTLWRSTMNELAEAHHEFDDVVLESKPNIVFYVIESYGAVAMTDPRYTGAWTTELDGMDERLRAAGWSTAGGTCAAPVHGGRSWMADATVMLGLKVAHQTAYEHVMSLVDTLPHLPGFFEHQGYTTVLIHPKDRARPGVELENPFRFRRTVFAADLGYTGRMIGWGEIPDQFTIDRVQEEILDPIEGPWFAFFHLVSSHIPWNEVPPFVSHWTDWQSGAVAKARRHDRTTLSETRMRISRFKRTLRDDDHDEKQVDDRDAQRFMGTVLYDLLSIGSQLETGPREPTLVVIMGDHQPPMLAEGTGPEVPVHIVASDPALLRAFLATGFEPGLRPRTLEADTTHEELFPLIVRTLMGPP